MILSLMELGTHAPYFHPRTMSRSLDEVTFCFEIWNICEQIFVLSPEPLCLARLPLASCVSSLRAIRAVILRLGCWCASHGFVGDTDSLKY
jgi:hypothetical protein